MPEPTYHVCPDFRIPPPPDGHLMLGTILKSLDENGVHDPLNKGREIAVHPEELRPKAAPFAQRGFTRSLTELQSTEGGIWAKIFGLGSLSANFSRTRGMGKFLTVKELLSREFLPDDEYMHQSLSIPKVNVYVTTRKLKVPVYMITGIMVATGASWSDTATKAGGARAKDGVAVLGTQMEFGGAMGHTKGKASVTGVEDSDDFVLGIRVRKIWWDEGIRQVSDQVVGRALDSQKREVRISERDAGMRVVDDFGLGDNEQDADASDERFVDDGTLTGMEPTVWILPQA
ncbi:hypothetical protein GGTG_05826 [Gaeumannomyces tritici R3-111a-1]|uniref:Uncharacterized protein n=1 Tax=Gaeumannomyces tritici (strain R3-111a-1) TaxID=644352 RepID=J3NX18_GAET3|nr:hypothetical protein GGTG_05826 [Gaeumannomyces tritici R3-111a-1]EJT75900.1 hypothetical protein GGTG_05826 [Gaeumannomyces tritici R3-111a-1]